MTLTILRSTGQFPCRILPHWDLSDIFFLMAGLGLWVLREEDRVSRVLFSSHHIKGTCYQHSWSLLMLTGVIWPKQTWSGFSPVTLRSSPQGPLWKEAILQRPHCRSGELCFASLKMDYLHKTIWTSSYICLFFPQLFAIPLFISVVTHVIYTFCVFFNLSKV